MDREVIEIMNVPFDAVDMDGAVKRVAELFEEPGQHIICTPNPEIVIEAQKDKVFMDILKAADLVVADGIGIVWASKYCHKRLTERVSGYDLCLRIFDLIKDCDKTVYFFGGSPGVAAAAAKKMVRKFPGLKFAGTRNGYFTQADESKIIDDINKASPDILLVGLGSPKQEKWIYDNLRFTGAHIAIGVGGSFDVMAGNVKRAPKIFQKFNIEWLYRLVTQPKRLKRQLRLPEFAFRILITKNVK